MAVSPSILTWLPIKQFQEIIAPLIYVLSPTLVLAIILQLVNRTPFPILQFAPIATFGPILQSGPIVEEGWI